MADEGNGYCCAFSDYDNDGLVDLYAGNLNDKADMNTRRLYHNEGNMKFTDVTEKLGLRANGYNVTCLWLDVDNDGDQDLFLANSAGFGAAIDAKYARTSLPNNGDGTFTDASKDRGRYRDQQPRCDLRRYRNDGDLDIYVTNSRYESLVFLNDGRGRFTESHEKTGGSVYYGHGCAFADLDNDGDLDLTAETGVAQALRIPDTEALRESDHTRNFIKLNLQGTVSNRSAVMSKVSLYDGGMAKTKPRSGAIARYGREAALFRVIPLCAFRPDAKKKYDVVIVFPSERKR